MTDYSGRLNKNEWEVRPVCIEVARALVATYHYAGGASNTAVHLHGLFRKDELWEYNCKGVAWWLPPINTAARAAYPLNWRGVLSLSRLVIAPDVEKNGCSFLLAHSMKLIDRNRWPCLLTFADTWQGHSGGIYKATNWQYAGMGRPEPVWVKDGKVISKKAGPRTRNKTEMEALGAVMIGKFAKHKYIDIAA